MKLLEEIVEKIIFEKDKKKYPVGTLEFNTSGKNPSEYLGFGTWVQWGSGRVPVGVDTNDTDFNVSEKIGGSKEKILTIDNLPSHEHSSNYYFYGNPTWTDTVKSRYKVVTRSLDVGIDNNNKSAIGIGCNGYTKETVDNTALTNVHIFTGAPTSKTGNGEALDVQSPYITCYIWKRTV